MTCKSKFMIAGLLSFCVALGFVLVIGMVSEVRAFWVVADMQAGDIETETEKAYQEGKLVTVIGGKMMKTHTQISEYPLDAKLSVTELNKLGGLLLILEIVNGSDSIIEVHFNSGMDADLALTQAGGEQIWSWSQDMMFTQALSQTLLKPGGVETYRFEVPASVLLDCRPPCEFEARFMGTTSNGTPLLPVLRLPLQ